MYINRWLLFYFTANVDCYWTLIIRSYFSTDPLRKQKLNAFVSAVSDI